MIPEPLGPMSAEDRLAIDQRKELIEARARALAEAAVAARQPWTRRIGPRDAGRGVDDALFDAATTVAAYRERYKVTSDLPVGGSAKNDTQRADRQRALAAVRAVSAAETSESSAVDWLAILPL